MLAPHFCDKNNKKNAMNKTNFSATIALSQKEAMGVLYSIAQGNETTDVDSVAASFAMASYQRAKKSGQLQIKIRLFLSGEEAPLIKVDGLCRKIAWETLPAQANAFYKQYRRQFSQPPTFLMEVVTLKLERRRRRRIA